MPKPNNATSNKPLKPWFKGLDGVDAIAYEEDLKAEVAAREAQLRAIGATPPAMEKPSTIGDYVESIDIMRGHLERMGFAPPAPKRTDEQPQPEPPQSPPPTGAQSTEDYHAQSVARRAEQIRSERAIGRKRTAELRAAFSKITDATERTRFFNAHKKDLLAVYPD